jgi:thiosulfate/3-mercaptopyruvate sulfurtransferase
MTEMTELPILIEPEELERILGQENLLIIDLSKASTHQQAHISGAIFIDYNQLVGTNKPVFGLLPEQKILHQIMSSVGLTPETHVVAYDDEGGGKAGRLLWTLSVLGHTNYSLLNGGLAAWYNEGHPTKTTATQSTPSEYTQTIQQQNICDADYIKSVLETPNTRIIDARSLQEFDGIKKYSNRGGHIPHAIHYEWNKALQANNNWRMREKIELLDELAALDVKPDNDIIVYCHTHHRSSFSFLMFQYLGFQNVRGYQGSWSDWGNRNDTPIENET